MMERRMSGNSPCALQDIRPLGPQLKKKQKNDLNPSLEAQIPDSRPKSQPQSPNPCPKTKIPDLSPKSQPQGPNPSLTTQIPAGWPKSQPKGPNPNRQEEKEKQKIPHLCETQVIDCCSAPSLFILNLLRQGMGTPGHLTLLRLFLIISMKNNLIFNLGHQNFSSSMCPWLSACPPASDCLLAVYPAFSCYADLEYFGEPLDGNPNDHLTLLLSPLTT